MTTQVESQKSCATCKWVTSTIFLGVSANLLYQSVRHYQLGPDQVDWKHQTFPKLFPYKKMTPGEFKWAGRNTAAASVVVAGLAIYNFFRNPYEQPAGT